MQRGTLYRLALLLPAIFAKDQATQPHMTRVFLKAEPWTCVEHHHYPVTDIRQDLIMNTLTFYKIKKTHPRRLQPRVIKTEAFLSARNTNDLAYYVAVYAAILVQPRSGYLLNEIYKVTLILLSPEL